MDLQFKIFSAAYARGTHHKLARDAILALDIADADAWRRLFLKHFAAFMQGSKAPDDEFKDFQNHVLHVRDGYWGGAADKVENWYSHLVKELKGERWGSAVFAAGVLSHYYTDPIHPFHTAQSDAENDIHRAVEWSINRSYDDLRKSGADGPSSVAPKPGEGAGWLRAFVVAGAETSNKQYERLIAHYDINQGVVDPPAGLDLVCRRTVASLLEYAALGFAQVLTRAIAEAGVKPPETNLVLDALAALLRVPRNKMLARIEDAAERRLVEAMYDELKTKGKVDATMPEDERVVRAAYEREVVMPRLAEVEKSRATLIQASTRQARPHVVDPSIALPPAPTAAVGAVAAPPPAPVATPASVVASPVVPSIATPAAAGPVVQTPPAPATPPVAKPEGQLIPATFAREDAPRLYLAAADDVERAPSIGPKMAERLYAVGVRTVADLLAAPPADLAEKLDHRSVDEDTIVDWQDQSRLVASIPGLRGTHAQLLVGAGYRTRDAVAEVAADKLCADVLGFAVSSEGQRVLRDGNPPDLERIKGWLASAKAARAA